MGIVWLVLIAILLASRRWEMPFCLIAGAISAVQLLVGGGYILLVGSQKLILEENGLRRKRWFGEKTVKYGKIRRADWRGSVLRIHAGQEIWSIPLPGAKWIGEDGDRKDCSFYYIRGRIQLDERRVARAFLSALASKIDGARLKETKEEIKLTVRKGEIL